MPGVIDLRPGDANEVAEAWRVLMPIRHEPVALMLSRQPLPTLDRQRYASAAGVARGAYVLADPPEGAPEVILIATGSEVAMTVDAYERLGLGQNAAGGVHAVDGTVRQATLLLPRRGAPAVGYRPGVGGEGIHVRLGPLGRSTRAIIGISTFGTWRH